MNPHVATAASEINCPHCQGRISVSDALAARLRDGIEKEAQARFTKLEQALKQREDEIARRNAQLQQQRDALELEVQAKLKEKAAELEGRLRERIRAEQVLELQDLRSQLAEKEKRALEAQRNELELRRKARELEEKERTLQLDIQRRLDEERKRVEEDVSRRISDEYRLRGAEKDQMVEALRRQIEELKRKAEQGSQQAQGEALELKMEEMLRLNFPMDRIEPVPKGVRGADAVQRVYSASGQPCGTILWEAKRTKAWSDGWVEKLKDDQREIGADAAVIVTQTLPKDAPCISQMSGVWIVDYNTACGIAVALRASLIQLAIARQASAGKGEKMELVYEYLCGPHFKQKIEGIVESFKTMKEDLEREKRAIQKCWAMREQQIDRVITNTVRMCGDIQGIIGSKLPTIGSLELLQE